MTTYKTIFSGRLEFGSEKSFDKVLKMFQHRVENYYRSDILLNEEEIFDKDSTSLNLPRFITQGSEKSWKNTISVLEYVAQFAVSGNIGAWMTEDGKILHHGIVEPISERATVQSFLKGRELAKEKGKETEAMAALNKAIEKYEKHAQAYEQRGHVNAILKNNSDAIRDFTKSIDYAPHNSESYFGRANVYLAKGEAAKALKDLEMTVKTSIPLQPLYWKARKLKADIHLKAGDFTAAMQDLKFYSSRKFKDDDPNKFWVRQMTFNYARALYISEKYLDAVEKFNTSIEMEEVKDGLKRGDMFMHRGLAKQKAGKNGFLKDFKEAVSLGCKEAEDLLRRKS